MADPGTSQELVKPSHWSLLPVVAVFGGCLLLALVDRAFLPDGLRGDLRSVSVGLCGFACCWAVMVGGLWSLAERLWVAGKSRPAQLGLRLCALSPALWLLWGVASSLFEGARAQEFSYGGAGPAVVFVAMVILAALAVRTWGRRRRLVRVLLVLGGASLLHWLDRTRYVGLYPVLHEALGLGAFLLVSTAIFTILKGAAQRVPSMIPGILFSVALVGGAGFHLMEFFEGPAAPRSLIFQRLASTRVLARRLPYRRPERETLDPVSLSPRFTRWNEQRQEARKRVAELRGERPLNLLIVSVDAVRRDHTSLHGYERQTTPFLEELARSAVVFEDARSPSTSSFFSLMSLLSGAYPSSISLRRGRDPDLLGRALAEEGVQSLGIYTDAVFTARPLDWPKPDLRLGLDRYEFNTVESEAMVSRVLDAVEELEKPFFLLTHLMDPHFPYVTHPGFEFGDQDIDAYDSELAFTDSQLRRLFQGLEAKGLLDTTVVVITSDHGEAFGEHGAYLHGGAPFEEQCRVPLLVHLPFLKEAKRINATVGLTALAPTLVDVFGARTLQQNESPSLLPLILGLADPEDYYAVVERPTIFERENFPPVTAIVRGRHKFRAQYDAGLQQVFDIEEDPLERADLSASQPKLFAEMAALYREWQSDCIFQREGRSDLDPAFAALRDEILLGREEAIPRILDYLEDPAMRDEAALLLFDLEMEGRLAHQDGLCSRVDSGDDGRAARLADLLKAGADRRPLGPSAILFGDPDVRYRRAAARILWNLSHLPFAAELAREHLDDEEDAEVEADLLGTLARSGAEVRIPDLIERTAVLEGPAASRLIISVMSRDSRELDQLIARTIDEEDSPMTHTLIQHLGANDTPFRRELMEKLLRHDRYTLRATTVRALNNFPQSRWHHDLLCKLVRREPHKTLRIDAAIQLNRYPGKEASAAILDALGFYPGSALPMGYLMATYRIADLATWSAKEGEFNGPIIIGEPIEIEFDISTKTKQYARRLIATVVRQKDVIRFEDKLRLTTADGRVLFERKCVSQTEVFCIDFPVSKGRAPMPLKLELVSTGRKEGESVGMLLSSLIRLRSPYELWPPEARRLDQVGILSRFTRGWRTEMASPELCFMGKAEGGVSLAGAREPRSVAEIHMLGAAEPRRIEIRLWDDLLGTFDLPGDNQPVVLTVPGLEKFYRTHAVNRFNFRILEEEGKAYAPRQVRDGAALKQLLLK